MSRLHHALVLALGQLDHLPLALQAALEILDAVAEGGRSGPLSPRLLAQLVQRGIKHHAHLLLVVYIAPFTPQPLSPIIRRMLFGTVALLAVPKLDLPV